MFVAVLVGRSRAFLTSRGYVYVNRALGALLLLFAVSFLRDGMRCPRKMLLSLDTLLLEPACGGALDNMNTPDDWARFQGSGEAR